MASLGFRSTSDIKPKALQIQIATHEEILAIGRELFKESTVRQRQEYERRLIEREEKLLNQLREKHETEVIELKEKHREENCQLEKKYRIMQDDALKIEAMRVKDIMTKQTTQLLQETILEGQKRLDEALVKARAEFDTEKEIAIEETIKSQRQIAYQEQLEQEKVHKGIVDKLNREWERRLKAENEKNNALLRKSLRDQEIKLNRIHQEELERELMKFEQQHKEEVEVLDGKVESLNKDNRGLENEIAELNEMVRYKMECLRRVLDSFRQFIETSPGFYEGQAEFVLKDLIPLASYTEC